MPKAEVGSTKYIANKMKAKGLQRLRWYCQICEKQCRDENGFKQHTMSEGHVRAMLMVGEDPKKYINEYSNQFKRDFLQLLKTAHGEKKVHMNNFYQEYIRDKEHIHMNATKWPSLTEFAKYLGREGICRVEEGERGLEIQWIDDSAEAIRRREDIKRKEKLAKGDEQLEAKLLQRQIRNARDEAEKRAKAEEERHGKIVTAELSDEPAKVSLSLGGKAMQKQREPTQNIAADSAPMEISSFSSVDKPSEGLAAKDEPAREGEGEEEPPTAPAPSPAPTKVSLSLGGLKSKPVNPLMVSKNPLSKKRETAAVEVEKKVSNAERIMREEMERKRVSEQRGHTGGGKRPRLE